jgi:hypothetical protein
MTIRVAGSLLNRGLVGKCADFGFFIFLIGFDQQFLTRESRAALMAGTLAVHTDSIGRFVGAGGAVRSDISFLLLHGKSPI